MNETGEITTMMIFYHEMYVSAVEAGFTGDQAMDIVIAYIQRVD